ncbi:hypothetical protein HYC85_014065 [Camellia sinensis]|uniref:Uncharacterized protein n=1 Tax=Camellia sinensis TaxID=4442 RepID=A0A7J7H8M8_CAMSI|nr:hypothetical protein HYC85_014065 [Camellia sinensis]
MPPRSSGYKDKRHDEERLTKVENQVGKILELLEQRMPFDGGHVKTPPSKLPEEQRVDIEIVDLNVSGIEKLLANSTKFEDEDRIRKMNEKEAMETPLLRKSNLVLILLGNKSSKLMAPKAKEVAKKQAKLVDGESLNNEQLSIPQKGRSCTKKGATKPIEVNVVTMSSSCNVVRGPQTRGTENCKASQWLRTPFPNTLWTLSDTLWIRWRQKPYPIGDSERNPNY